MTSVKPSTTQALNREEIFAAHEGGKLSINSTRPLKDMRDLSLAYTPGVATVCEAIAEALDASGKAMDLTRPPWVEEMDEEEARERLREVQYSTY